MPAEQATDTGLDLRLEVGSLRAVERDRRLDRFGLRPAARQPVERHALAGDRRISKPGGAVEAVGDRRGVELAGERDEIALAALAGEIDQQRRPFEMVARLGPVTLAVGRAPPFAVEILAEGPAVGIEEVAAEEVDDARRPAQISALTGYRMPGEERF